MLLNPLRNSLNVNKSSLLDWIWIMSVVREAQVQVMGSFLNHDHFNFLCVCEILQESASLPRIVPSITENDVWLRFEVLLRISSSEKVESPVVIWGRIVFSLARFSKRILVPIEPCEAALGRVISHRHGKLLALHVIPSKRLIAVRRRIDIVEIFKRVLWIRRFRNIQAGQIAVRIIVNPGSVSQC